MKSIIYGFGIIITIMSIFGIAAFIMYFTNNNNQKCENYMDDKQYDDKLPITLSNSDMPINPVPYQIFVIWFGVEMSDTRKKCLESIGKLGVPVILITKDNLHEWIAKDDPLHPAFYYLSGVHKADYLRCYLTHHYGGGYSDIKYYDDDTSWVESFDKINQDPNIWLLGGSEKNRDDIGCHTYHRLASDKKWDCKLIKNMWKKLVLCGAFICRKKTKFSYDLINRIHTTLSNNFRSLILNPPIGNRSGFNSNYPLRWTQILGEIFHPLQYLYIDYVKSGLPTFNYNIKHTTSTNNGLESKDDKFKILELVEYLIQLPIDIVVYINLESRKDRKNKMDSLLSKYNLPFERFDAIKNKYGALGCTKSHSALLKQYLNKNMNVMVLEDDIEFTMNMNAFQAHLRYAFDVLGDNWDVIMLTGNLNSLKSTSTKHFYIKKIKSLQTSAGYIINKRYIGTLLECLETSIKKLEKYGKSVEKTDTIDRSWKKLQKKDNWYLLNPTVCKVCDDFSDIENKHEVFHKDMFF